ncbi:MAG: hypothetical protein PHS41_13315 [Victivallaceae bacterium]|nr:hypothetical protein [Victivallaceae bacterium]
MKNKMTIREFAELIGVSPGTVSKALSPDPKYRISPAKSIYVQEKAVEYGFELRTVSQTVEKRKGVRLGLVCGAPFSFLGAFLWEGAQEYCLAQGVKLLFDFSGQSVQRESEALRQMTSEQVDAMIYWPAGGGENHKKPQRLIARADNVSAALPFIYIGEGAEFENAFSFRFQAEEVAIETAKHHLSLGCKHFVILHFNYAWGADFRAAGKYRETLLANGVPEENIRETGTFTDSDEDAMAVFQNADAVWTEHIFLLYSHLEWIARYRDIGCLHVGGVGFVEFALTFKNFFQPTLDALGRKGTLADLYASSDIKMCSLRRIGAAAAKKAIEFARAPEKKRGGTQTIAWLTPEEIQAGAAALRTFNMKK